MKATFKSIAVALSILAVTVAVLVAVDANVTTDAVASKTYIKVTVVDLDGNPVHNAKVIVNGCSFNTDNKGLSPSIELNNLTNCYDAAIEQWKTVSVTVLCDGFTPAITFNCAVYVGQTRKLTVKLYPIDGSDLPYVVYVESPPADYVKSLVNGN